VGVTVVALIHGLPTTHTGVHAVRSFEQYLESNTLETSPPASQPAMAAHMYPSTNPPKSNHHEASGFSLDELLQLRMAHCKAAPSAFNRSGVANLAIARTGSESLTSALRRTGLPTHHSHDCTLADVGKRGAKVVLASLRHPVSRIVSGIQRRDSDASSNTRKHNVLFSSYFLPQRLPPLEGRVISADPFLDALRNVSHPLHSRAREVTLGPTRQSFMLPVVEFYLLSSSQFTSGGKRGGARAARKGKTVGRRSKGASKAKHQGNDASVKDGHVTTRREKQAKALDPADHVERWGAIEVLFLCTESLTDDFNRAASALGLEQSMKDDAKAHTSPVHSDSQTAHAQLMSDVNQQWISEVYAKDVRLYNMFCGEESSATEPEQVGAQGGIGLELEGKLGISPNIRRSMPVRLAQVLKELGM